VSVVVLVPVLNRPDRALPLAKNLRDTCDATLLFIPSFNDREQKRACQLAAREIEGTYIFTVPWKPAVGDYAKKINIGFKFTQETWVLTGADDLFFHPGWLEAAMAATWSTGKWVIGTNDLCNPTTMKGIHSTHTLVHRDYIVESGGGWDGPGVLLHEGYDHQYIDNELVTAAKQRHQWVHAKDSHVEHLHPLCHGSVRDTTYDKALARGKQDGELFRRRLRASQSQTGQPGHRVRS
jgi:hypothetical protein